MDPFGFRYPLVDCISQCLLGSRRKVESVKDLCILLNVFTGADSVERETAAYAADVLCGESAARRADEGAVGGDDRPLATSHPRLVPEQTLQGQEETDYDQANGTTPPGTEPK